MIASSPWPLTVADLHSFVLGLHLIPGILYLRGGMLWFRFKRHFGNIRILVHSLKPGLDTDGCVEILLFYVCGGGWGVSSCTLTDKGLITVYV